MPARWQRTLSSIMPRPFFQRVPLDEVTPFADAGLLARPNPLLAARNESRMLPPRPAHLRQVHHQSCRRWSFRTLDWCAYITSRKTCFYAFGTVYRVVSKTRTWVIHMPSVAQWRSSRVRGTTGTRIDSSASLPAGPIGKGAQQCALSNDPWCAWMHVPVA